MKNAVVGQQTISFGYRTGGQGEVNTRRVQPWGLASWHGRWYLTGFDLDRGAPRVFRLSRIDGAVSAVTAGRRRTSCPPTTGPRDGPDDGGGARVSGTATVRVREGRGQSLRRRGESTWGRRGSGPGSQVPFTDDDALADEVSGYGADVVVVEPAEVRDLVVARLRGALAAHRALTGVRGMSTQETATAPARPAADDGPVAGQPPGHRHRARPRPTSASASSSSRPTCGCSTCAATARCPTSSSTPSGRAAGSSSATPTRSPGRCASAVDEALTLMVGLRALAAVPGLGERDTIERAMAKLEAATGASAEAASRVEVSIDEGVEAGLLADAPARGRDARRVHLRYLVPSRDESTERDVDPMRVVNLDAHWYLEGWCHRAQDTRLFRMDRIESLEVLDVDGTPPADARLRDLDAGTFTPREDDTQVTLHLSRGAAWVADYYPVDSVRTRPRRVEHGDAAHRRHALAAPAALAPRRARHRRVAARARAGSHRRRAWRPSRRTASPTRPRSGPVGSTTCGGGS